MTEEELGTILRESKANAPLGEKGIAPILFGIRYADELSKVSVRAVQRFAEIEKWSEVGKGIKLARYVTIKSRVVKG